MSCAAVWFLPALLSNCLGNRGPGDPEWRGSCFFFLTEQNKRPSKNMGERHKRSLAKLNVFMMLHACHKSPTMHSLCACTSTVECLWASCHCSISVTDDGAEPALFERSGTRNEWDGKIRMWRLLASSWRRRNCANYNVSGTNNGSRKSCVAYLRFLWWDVC